MSELVFKSPENPCKRRVKHKAVGHSDAWLGLAAEDDIAVMESPRQGYFVGYMNCSWLLKFHIENNQSQKLSMENVIIHYRQRQFPSCLVNIKVKVLIMSLPESVQISLVSILGSMALGSQLRSQWSCVGHLL